MTTVHSFAGHLDTGSQIDAIFLDFSKAFDKVAHQCLFAKLSYYGIQGTLLNWLMYFLTGRSQKVVLNNTCSESTSVLSGVPQGSVLGPLLFLLFINDLPDVVSSQLKLYADDALLYRTISSEDDVQALQQDLNSLSEWAQK